MPVRIHAFSAERRKVTAEKDEKSPFGDTITRLRSEMDVFPISMLEIPQHSECSFTGSG